MSKPFQLVCVSLIVLGIVLRALLATHRLSIISDEAAVIDRALRLFVEGPNPKWFLYPSLHLYAIAVAEGLLYLTRWASGLSPTPESFAEWYFDSPRTAYMVARIWSVGAGVAILAIIYRLGVRLASPSAGLLAATFLAVSPMHIYYSAMAKPDAAMVLAMQAAGLFAVRFVQGEGGRLPWGTAVMSGLSATLKYPGGAAWFAAPVAMLVKHPSDHRSVLLTCGKVMALATAAAIVFVAGTPFAAVEPLLLHRDLMTLWQTANQDLPSAEGLSTWSLYLGEVLPASLSFPILGFAMWGLVVLLRRDWRSAVVALLPAAVYAVPTLAASPLNTGYIMPMLPTLCLCAGAGVERARAMLPQRSQFTSAFLGGSVLLCVLSPLESAICNQIRAFSATAQEQATYWIRNHLAPGSRILGTATGVKLQLTAERLAELLAEATKGRPTGGKLVRHLQRTTPPGTGYYFYDMDSHNRTSELIEFPVLEYDPEWIVVHGFQYIVDSEFKMRRYFRAPDRYPLPYHFQQWLAKHGELVFTTHPGSRGFPDWRDAPERVRALEPRCGFEGGELSIYRIKEGS